MASVVSNTYETRYLQLDVWEISTDAVNNTSLVGWKLSSIGGYSSYYYIADTTVTINGQQVYFYDAPAWDTNWATKTFPITTGEVSGQITVPHNADGKKTLAYSLNTRVYISTTPAEFSGTLALSEITQVQDFSVTAADMVIGQACNVTWTPTATNLYYKVHFLVGNRWFAVSGLYPNRTIPYTYKSTNLSATLAKGLPNAASGEMTVTVTAYREFECTTQVGNPAVATCTVTVPQTSDFLPDLSMTLAPTGSLPAAFSGLYIQGKTGISATLTATAKQDATIQAYTLQAEGAEYTSISSGITVNTLTQYGSQRITGSVQDSRGFTASAYQDIQVIPYTRPKIQPISGQRKVIADRCDAQGNLSDSGSYLIIKAKRSYSPVMSANVQKNYCMVRYRYKQDTAASWSAWTTLIERTSTSDEVVTSPLLGTLQAKVSYQVQIQAVDDIGESSATTITVSTEKVQSHEDGARGSFAFGKLVEDDDVFDIAPDKTLIVRGGIALGADAVLALLDIIYPIGSVFETTVADNPGDTIGGGWVSITSMYTGVYRWQRTD